MSNHFYYFFFFSCHGFACALSVFISLLQGKFDTILMLVIGFPVKIRIAKPSYRSPASWIASLERRLSDFEVAATGINNNVDLKICYSAESIKNEMVQILELVQLLSRCCPPPKSSQIWNLKFVLCTAWSLTLSGWNSREPLFKV